jgi:peptidoglycan/LPS O-acetylase OafA/YrhL
VPPNTQSSGRLAVFRRITSGGSYIAEIDGLRFIAIVSVLCFHVGRMSELMLAPKGTHPTPAGALPALLVNALYHGDRGVSIFFAISGFVLGIPFARERLLGEKHVSLKQYLLRRLTRIEPPYMVSQFIRLYPVMLAKSLTLLQILPHFLAGLFYLHLLIYHTLPEVQLVGWSLEIEVQFYLLAPLLARIFFRRSAGLRSALIYGFLLAHCLVVLRALST